MATLGTQKHPWEPLSNPYRTLRLAIVQFRLTLKCPQTSLMLLVAQSIVSSTDAASV